MTNTLSKELKYTTEDFRHNDIAENLINLCSYNCLKKHSSNCAAFQTYSQYCVEGAQREI